MGRNPVTITIALVILDLASYAVYEILKRSGWTSPFFDTVWYLLWGGATLALLVFLILQKKQEVATATTIIIAAEVACFDSFRKSGWTATQGPDSGWYPFWSAAMMGVAGIAVLILTLRAKNAKPLFSSPEGTRAFAQVAVPMLIGTALISPLGFYVVSAGLMGFFARWIGKYRVIWSAVIAISVPLALYLAFEVGFRVPLPKSLFYTRGFPF